MWQRRFWEHQIRDPDDFNRHVEYIHWNPVKHGHETCVIDWPCSTFHRYIVPEFIEFARIPHVVCKGFEPV